MPQHDHDDLAALDFYPDDISRDDIAESDALDFSVPDDVSGEELAGDALLEYMPIESQDTASDLEAIASQTQGTAEDSNESEDGATRLFTVTNPPGSVSVSALMDGRTERVDLSPKATSMSESELAEEIVILADLARQQGLAGQHTYLMADASLADTGELGMEDRAALRDFMENCLNLTTPEQAAAAQAHVFATRYVSDR